MRNRAGNFFVARPTEFPTALHHNVTIVSRNVADFAHLHVPVLNPRQP